MLVIREGNDPSNTMTLRQLSERLGQYAEHFPDAKIFVVMDDGVLRNIMNTAVTNDTPDGETFALITIEPVRVVGR